MDFTLNGKRKLRNIIIASQLILCYTNECVRTLESWHWKPDRISVIAPVVESDSLDYRWIRLQQRRRGVPLKFFEKSK